MGQLVASEGQRVHLFIFFSNLELAEKELRDS
ncbi:MAG: hypothetical protein ACJA2R_000332 [Saprospiraceae bacterium]|jgi:hypothetical protein